MYEIVALIYKSTMDISSFSNYKCCLLWLKLTSFKNCYIQFPTSQVSSFGKYYLFYWLFNYSCSCLCLYISISKTFNCSIGHILSLKQFISTFYLSLSSWYIIMWQTFVCVILIYMYLDAWGDKRLHIRSIRGLWHNMFFVYIIINFMILFLLKTLIL